MRNTPGLTNEKWLCYFEGDSKDQYKIFESLVNIEKMPTILKLAAKVDLSFTQVPNSYEPNTYIKEP